MEDKQKPTETGHETGLITTRNLTERQRMFIRHYTGDAKFNASKAALMAGYSKRSAYSSGNDNVNNPLIKAAIDQQITIQAERIDVDVEEIVKELSKLAFPSPIPGVKPVSDNNRLRALELLAKYKGMLTERYVIEPPPPQELDLRKRHALEVAAVAYKLEMAGHGPDIIEAN